MVREARSPKVHDWFVNHVVKKHPHAEELRLTWSADPDPVVASAGWALTTERVRRRPEGLDLAGLLDVIEAEMKDAPDRLQWAMNECLGHIGIEHAEHRARAIDIGERLKVLEDYPTSPAARLRSCPSGSPRWSAASTTSSNVRAHARAGSADGLPPAHAGRLPWAGGLEPTTRDQGPAEVQHRLRWLWTPGPARHTGEQGRHPLLRRGSSGRRSAPSRRSLGRDGCGRRAGSVVGLPVQEDLAHVRFGPVLRSAHDVMERQAEVGQRVRDRHRHPRGSGQECGRAESSGPRTGPPTTSSAQDHDRDGVIRQSVVRLDRYAGLASQNAEVGHAVTHRLDSAADRRSRECCRR